MSEKCRFDMGKRCVALTTKECEGCTFRKTEEEFNSGVEHAKEILKAKGLRPILNWNGDHQIMSTIEI